MRDFDSIKQREMGSIENRVRHIYNRGYEDGYKDGRESIKALEQEPKTDVLDKIRAEMEELIEWHDCPIELDGGNDAWYCEAVRRCVEIIDKYRQEG